jgi:hypothetical protein
MAIIKIRSNTTTQQTSDTINAVCVDVVDLGIVDTPWGRKPQVRTVFETDQQNDYGEPRTLIRTFNMHTHEKSALSINVASWTGRNLSQEAEDGQLNLSTLVGQQARLKLEPTLTKNGNAYDKIVEILPAGEVHVVPSGKYRRAD